MVVVPLTPPDFTPPDPKTIPWLLLPSLTVMSSVSLITMLELMVTLLPPFSIVSTAFAPEVSNVMVPPLIVSDWFPVVSPAISEPSTTLVPGTPASIVIVELAEKFRRRLAMSSMPSVGPLLKPGMMAPVQLPGALQLPLFTFHVPSTAWD